MIHVLDTQHLRRRGIIAATALETEDGLALFDTGPESTFENVAGELKRCGFDARDVRHVFLSHIHFDHAGVAWRFAELGATIYVHPRGAPHLIDPGKLIRASAAVYGEERYKALYGDLVPIDASAVLSARRSSSISPACS